MGPNLRRKLQYSVYLALVLCSCVWANGEDVENVHAKVGAAVTFRPEKASENQILWTFGSRDPNVRIVKVSSSKVYVPASSGFQGRLHMNRETGALTISNLRENDTGVYQQQCIGSNISSQRFRLTVYSLLSPPLINVVNSQHGGHHPLQVECSVDNSRDLSLSWFKGKVRLISVSSVELARLSASVEVGLSDTSAYVCEAKNPVEKQSTSFHPPEACLKNGESSSWCHSELTVRLVLSAIIGLVLIVLVVDHLWIRK